MEADVKLEFRFGGHAAGRFDDVVTYPKVPGRYKYMPYRGPGHLLLQEECRRSGFARCTYAAPGGDCVFSARTCAEYGILDIDEIS
jgi:hypothetical protein